MKNRKMLSDIDCMSGTGWQPEDYSIECPECSKFIDVRKLPEIVKCKNCKTNFKMEYGQQYFMRISEE